MQVIGNFSAALEKGKIVELSRLPNFQRNPSFLIYKLMKFILLWCRRRALTEKKTILDGKVKTCLLLSAAAEASKSFKFASNSMNCEFVVILWRDIESEIYIDLYAKQTTSGFVVVVRQTELQALLFIFYSYDG